MKKTLTFNLSTITSTQSKADLQAWDDSVEAFNKKDFTKSFYSLIDYLNPELRKTYGNVSQTEFNIPHGSIIVNIQLDNGNLKINAPFLEVPEGAKIPLLRQIATLNFGRLDLAQIILNENKLQFEYSCPIKLMNPWKIYYVLEEICRVGDKYDDEFITKFDAKRIYEPKITPYPAAVVDEIYNVIQLSCNECLENVKDFENDRKYGYAWNIIGCTLRKIMYYAHPQGQLFNDVDKAVYMQDREDITLPEVVAQGKAEVERIKNISKEKLAEDLYFVETLVSPKRRSNLKNIQNNFEKGFENVSKYYSEKDYMTCCIVVVYNFYNMYFYNQVQDDVNAVVVDALTKSSAKPFDEAAPILYTAMKNIMDGNLTKEVTGINVEEITNNIKKAFSSLFGKK